MPETPLGRFCWYELLTKDPDGAPGFYGAITGWGTMPFEGGTQPYTMWTRGGTPLGGIMKLPDEAVAGGAPSHWLVHISTPDVTATVAKAERLGAQVMHRESIPMVGEFAIIRDPQGVYFSAYQPAGDTPGHDGPPEVGEFSWNELMTTDWAKAWTFYSALFGWAKGDAMDLGAMGTYQTFGRGAHPLGGMFDRPKEVPAPCWLFYLRVPDVGAAVAKVEAAGGTLLNGPMEVPGGSMIAQCLDPSGAAFAVHAMAQA